MLAIIKGSILWLLMLPWHCSETVSIHRFTNYGRTWKLYLVRVGGHHIIWCGNSLFFIQTTHYTPDTLITFTLRLFSLPTSLSVTWTIDSISRPIDWHLRLTSVGQTNPCWVFALYMWSAHFVVESLHEDIVRSYKQEYHGLQTPESTVFASTFANEGYSQQCKKDEICECLFITRALTSSVCFLFSGYGIENIG